MAAFRGECGPSTSSFPRLADQRRRSHSGIIAPFVQRAGPGSALSPGRLRPPRRGRLCAGAQRTVGRTFSRCRTNHAGPGQPEHTYGRLALRGLPCRRSAPPLKAVRLALHAQTWKLARHGRIRTRRSVEPMPEPPHSSRPSNERSRLGRIIATSITPQPIGISPQTMPVSSSRGYTPHFE